MNRLPLVFHEPKHTGEKRTANVFKSSKEFWSKTGELTTYAKINTRQVGPDKSLPA